MSGRTAIPALSFVLGLALFSWLVASVGVAAILDRIATGWTGILAAFLLWLVIYQVNASAWRLALGPAGRRIGAAELFMVTVSGFAINYVTPLVALGGEPYRVAALSRAIGTRDALSAVVLYRMVHLLGHMAFLLCGIVLAFAMVPLSPGVAGGLGVSGAAIALVMFLVLDGTRRGLFDRLARALARRPSLGPVSRAAARYGADLAEMDRVITGTFRDDRRAFLGSVSLEFLSRFLMGVEVFVVLRSLGVAVPLPEALMVYVLYSIVINLFFFVPLNLGAREGGILLGMEGLAAGPEAGVSLGIILRIREFVWIAVGLLFVLILPRFRPDPDDRGGAKEPDQG